MIHARDLGRRFGERWALKGVSFNVSPGECLGILGRNGAGKTTLVRLLTGQLKPTEGSAEVAGFDPASAPMGLRRLAGVMPEERALLEDLAGAQYLAFAGRLHGLAPAVLAARIDELQACLQVDFRTAVPIRDYSYGMKKKLAFATAVLQGPRVLFLDEPFEGLDPDAARTLLELLGGLRDQGVTLVLTSHQLHQAERLCTRILLVEAGRVALDGTASDVLGPDEDLEGLFLRTVGRGQRSGSLSWM